MFGKVIDGMLTLRKIENVPTGPNNRPKLAVKIVGEMLNEKLVNYLTKTFYQSAAKCDSGLHRTMRTSMILIHVFRCIFIIYFSFRH